MANAAPVLVEREGPVCTIVLNRPGSQNALTLEMIDLLADAFRGLRGDEGVRVALLRGADERAFCSGLDLGAPGQEQGETGGIATGFRRLIGVLEAIAAYEYPVVAAIGGFALGGGCELALACDLRIASHAARIGMPHARLGLVHPLEGHRRFVDLIGLGNAAELFLTGRPVSGQRAFEMGLVNRVVPSDDLESAARGLCEQIAGNAPLSIKGAKAMLRSCRSPSVPAPRDEAGLQELVLQAARSRDLAEALRAFREKRAPRFTGR